MLTPNQIISGIEALTDAQRAEVVDFVVKHYKVPLEIEIEPEIEPEVLALLEQRLADYDAGKTKSIPAEEVFAKLDAMFDR